MMENVVQSKDSSHQDEKELLLSEARCAETEDTDDI